MGMIYIVTSYDDRALEKVMDTHDSLGAEWYPIDALTQDMLSPFAFKSMVDIKKLSLD